jgi:BirA family biotin operon repressor/biotin-[acetyl-CoA-carboxylase] ligase
VVVADTQSAGRGRFNRQWFSPPGVNLYFSVLLRPPVPPSWIPQISLVSCMAVVRGIQAVVPGLALGIKWPNDILLQGRKLCGILCDMRSETDLVHHVIVGVGVNVNVAPGAFPPAIAESATSLRIVLGREISRPQLLAAILLEMEESYLLWLSAGFDLFRETWRQLSVLKGRTVIVTLHDEPIEGRVVDLSPLGALILQLPDGSLREIFSGDVHVERS